VARPIVVPDASVLLKWVLESDNEEDRDAALALKASWLSGSCGIVVPQLWVYEVGNVLGLKRSATAQTLLRAMVDLELEDVAAVHHLEHTYQLIHKYRVTFYDAAYHGLAIAREGTLVTADAAYVRNTQSAGHAVLLSNWRHALH